MLSTLTAQTSQGSVFALLALVVQMDSATVVLLEPSPALLRQVCVKIALLERFLQHKEQVLVKNVHLEALPSLMGPHAATRVEPIR
mmetsp:Transcript_53147/g.140413  ORF Transcript_53147/g.140413 Transcript_53147/m.140413 type:complete len:86 (-) Transcript_53147:988-1245(-)